MNRIHRCVGVLAALGGTLFTLAVAAPTALATIPDPGGGPNGLAFRSPARGRAGGTRFFG